jgi:hypothetical protein
VGSKVPDARSPVQIAAMADWRHAVISDHPFQAVAEAG